MSQIIKLVALTTLLFFAYVTIGVGAEANLRVGYLTRTTSNGALFVAKETGIFERNGLNVELLYVQPVVLTQSMLAGEMSVAVSGGVTPIEANIQGADFVLLGSLLRKAYPISFLVTRNEITKVEQLKGKRIAASRLGASPHRYLELALKKLGIDPERDVTFFFVGQESVRVASVKAGTTDATVLPAEFTVLAEKLGLQVLMDLRKLEIEYLSADLVTTRRYVKSNEESVRRYVKSMVEAIHYFKTRKDRSIEIMARYMREADRKILEAGYDFYSDAYERKPYVAIKGIETVLEDITRRNPKAKEAKPEQFYDSRFIEELDKNGFIDGLYK